MIFEVRAQLGFLYDESSTWDARFQVTHGEADTLGSRFGSYHVHAMGRHTRDYLSGQQLPQLPTGLPIPKAIDYQRLKYKQRAGAVSGNIGEMVCWLIASRLVGLAAHEVAHLQTVAQTPTAKTRCPDYLIRAGQKWTESYQRLQAAPWLESRTEGVIRAAKESPRWWPAECKVRSGGKAAAQAVLRDAFQQLAAYWWHIREEEPRAAGYGIVSTVLYGPDHAYRPGGDQSGASAPGPTRASPAEATVHVATFMPDNHGALLAALDEAPHPSSWGRPGAPRGWRDPHSAAVARECIGGPR